MTSKPFLSALLHLHYLAVVLIYGCICALVCNIFGKSLFHADIAVSHAQSYDIAHVFPHFHLARSPAPFAQFGTARNFIFLGRN